MAFDGDGDTAVIKTKSVKYTDGTAKLLPSDVAIKLLYKVNKSPLDLSQKRYLQM